jgi:RHS repeat-associated protein
MANFVFDSRNRLIQAGDTAYRYDAENQRIGVNKIQYVVNSQPALSQVLVKEDNGQKTFYVYGLGLIGQESNGEYLTYHFDFRGSTVALTDENAQVTERFQYSSYGLRISGDAAKTPFLFNGMYGVMTDSNGLYYMRARFYSPEIRRFVNQDILLGHVAEGQTLNWYAFVIGNPLTKIDPTGRWFWIVIPGICSGGGCEIILGGMFGGIMWSATNSKDIVLPIPKTQTQRERVIRVRHHTSPAYLVGIMSCATINPSRSGGVDVEIPPFGTVRLWRNDSPIRRFGAVAEGAYIEFDTYPDRETIMVRPYIGKSKNAATIITLVPLSLVGRNPEYVKRSWWQLLLDQITGNDRRP